MEASGGGGCRVDGEFGPGAQVVITEAGAEMFVEKSNAEVATEAVGIADVALVVLVIGCQLNVFVEFVGSAYSNGAGFFVRIVEQLGKEDGAVIEVPFAVLVELDRKSVV